jgi:hypothetical protein
MITVAGAMSAVGQISLKMAAYHAARRHSSARGNLQDATCRTFGLSHRR